MKRIIFFLSSLFVALTVVNAQNAVGVKVDNLNLKRNGEYISVKMDVDFSSLDVASNRAIVFTPIIVNGTDSVELSSVSVYGRRRYYYYERNNESIVAADKGVNYRESEMPETMNYSVVIPYENWMDGAYLLLNRCDYGCCSKVVDESASQLAFYKEHKFAPRYVYVRPAAELKKTRSLKGSAYIDYVVNKTDVNPSYRNNTVELAKIVNTIDSVKNDSDITITSISIKGFASPEGSYASNEVLAKGRTASLKKYVENLYKFSPDFIKTSYEVEDWANLRKYVAASSLPNKDAIIAFIDGNREPDNKEWMIKSTYPEDYKVMYKECYPALRHSDYEIEYVICSYTSVEEIKEVFHETPQKLSLNEFYLLARQYGDDKRMLSDIFETAVRMYPNDSIANLNAAISEMQNNDTQSAKVHLDKAGSSPEAVYARGIYAAMLKEYDTALSLLDEALKQGVTEAQDAIEQVNKMK